MHVGVEIFDALVVAFDSTSKGGLALSIARAFTITITLAQGTITVDIHIDKVAAVSLKVHDSIVGEVIAAIAKVLAMLAMGHHTYNLAHKGDLVSNWG